MPEVTLVRRWGSNAAGSTVDVTDTEAAWLVGSHYASEDGTDHDARAGSVAPGTDGADLRAGGDLSRGGGMQVVRGPRGTDEAPMNRAGRIEGAPKPGGSVYLTPHEVEAKKEQAELAQRQRDEARRASENGEPRPVVRSASGEKQAPGGDGNETTRAARSASKDEVKSGDAGKASGK